MKAVGDRIIVRPFPDNPPPWLKIIRFTEEKPKSGEVIAVGPGKKGKMDVHVGDHIMFGPHAQQDVTIRGERLLSMSDKDVLFVME